MDNTHPEVEESLASLAEDIGDDGVLEVVELFIADTPRAAASVRDAFARTDVETLRRAAHTLKSTSATVGAWKLSFCCMEIERLAKLGKIPECNTHIAAMDAEFAKALAQLERARKQYASA